ncbi:MAG: lysophospholipid acyltransferase family protein [Xanthomonadales bacterium]|nr:lysophospholipid acyltransferase family protein [Xanthomonadales bacterium]
MKKILFWPYQLYVWLLFAPLVVVLTLLFSSLTVLFSMWVNPNFASRVFGATWARCCGWLTPIRVRVEGREHCEAGRSYVVVANHQSLYDIVVVYGWLDLDLKWVMKQELRSIPGIGIGCEKAGHIFIDRHKPKEAGRTIAAALERLGDGVGMLFFPEGTRSRDGRLLPFKRGAFRTAVEQQLPLLPITLLGTRDICPARTLKIFPGRVRMVIHPAIETAGLGPEKIDALANRSRQVIEAAMPAGLR